MKHFLHILLFVYFAIFSTEIFAQLVRSKIVSHKLCRDDSDCYENSFCYGNDGTINGRCKCKENFYLVQKNKTYYECFQESSFKQSCKETLQCQIGMGLQAYCDENTNLCECEEGAYVAKDGICYIASKMGERCRVDFNCRLQNGSYAFCSDGHCACPIKHHPSEDLRNCIPSSYLGEACESDDNCRHTHAKCYGVCNCIAGYVVSNNQAKCLKAAALFGEPCQEEAQCSEYLLGSYCTENETCECRSGEHGYGNKCYKNVKVGDRCTTFQECIVSAAANESIACENGACSCLIGESDNEYGCELRGSSRTIQPVIINIVLGFVVILCSSYKVTY